jgi:hypothetical protein
VANPYRDRSIQGKPRDAGGGGNPLPPGSIPNANPEWGVNRLEKELRDRGFMFQKPTDAPGKVLKNEVTGEELRIMERPSRIWRTDPAEKHLNDFYYRYRRSINDPYGPAVTIPNKK